MRDYEKMYCVLFNAVTDALRQMEDMNFGSAETLLKLAQAACEEIYMKDGAEESV